MFHLSAQRGPGSNLYGLLLCLILIFVATVIRVSHLGDADYGLDEIFHVYVSQELIQGNPPILPSGYNYQRGIVYSYLVAIAGFLGGFNEVSLRMPSVVCGVLVIILVYWMTARWFSRTAGVVAAFITAFSPIEVLLSREVRMYTLLQVLFLLIVYLFYEGFESGEPVKKNLKSQVWRLQAWMSYLQIRPLWLICAGILFLLTWKVHVLIQPAISGLMIYVLMMAGVAAVLSSMPTALRQKYLGSCVAMFLAVIVASLLFPEKLDKLFAAVHATPEFYQERANNWSYFRWELLDEYPILFGCLPISCVICILKRPQIGLYLCVAFLVPFLLHSVVFSFKAYRYIFHILPLMYMVSGVGVAEILRVSWTMGVGLNEEHHVPQKTWLVVVSLVLCVSIGGTLINMPWFMRTVRNFSNHYELPHFADVQHHKWQNAMKYVTAHQKSGDVMISGYPILTGYYGWTQRMYAMNDVILRLNRERDLRNQQGNLIDYTFGAEVLQNLDDFKRVIETHASGWIVTYLWRGERFWNHPDRPIPLTGTFPDDVMRYLEENFTRVNIPGAPALAVWRWDRNVVDKNTLS